jgi:Fic family protein
VEYTNDIVWALNAAVQKVGNLEGLCRLLPNPYLLSGAYVRREAVLSSRIEGTQSTQPDLYLFEIDAKSSPRPEDIQEVQNYVKALDYAVARRQTLPLSLRFIRELHGILMQGVRGQNMTPGEFRTSQNWIGGRTPSDARFVPPPVPEMTVALDDMEKFLHRPEQEQIPPLIESALLHYQFETVHPFLDGNGRVGRLLVIVLALERKCLSNPLLYLSAYFEKHRNDYYDQLFGVTQTGKWEPWLLFFLDGVADQAADAIRRSETVLALYDRYRKLGLSAPSLRLLDHLLHNPYITVSRAAELLNAGYTSAKHAIMQLEEKRVLVPLHPEQKRGQIFVAQELMDAFTADMP